MASIKNLKIITTHHDNEGLPTSSVIPRAALFNNHNLKQIYYNNVLVWENTNQFIFTNNLSFLDLTTLNTNTIIFEGFSSNSFKGSYEENTIPKTIGQMSVNDEGDN